MRGQWSVVNVAAPRLWLTITLSGVALPGGPAAGQAGAPHRWDREFVRVTAACARGDGSVLVTDPGDDAVILLPAAGPARQVGRRGNGPGEYQTPGACFLLPGDTALVFDRMLRRFTVVPSGEGGPATLAWPRALGAGWHEPVGVDPDGAVVLRGPRATGGREPVLRWHRGRGTTDTVTWLDAGRVKTMGAEAASVSRVIPFTPRDGVVAGVAVGIAVVHPAPYHAETWRNGMGQRGAPLPFTAVSVDQGDIDAYVESQAPPPGTLGVRSDGQPIRMPRGTFTLENLGLTRQDFPKTKPPFDPDGLVAGGDGLVWVRRHRPSAEPAAQYDVLTAAGTRRETVTLPPGRRLLAVTVGRLIVAVTEDDGREFVEWIARR